jgi:hypothetical protein
MLRVVSRREAITVMLLHLADVRHGLWDGRAEGGGTLLMCSVWNSPAYRRLEALLPQLRRDDPGAWRASYAMFEQPSFRPRAWCPRCHGVTSPEHVGQLHKHRRAVALVPRMIRVPLFPVAEVDVERAVSWLDEHWGSGAVTLPDELRDVAAVA